jgi:lauroyl/myristoyl acyltransferase
LVTLSRPMVAGLSNDFGILLARAITTQARDLAHNLAACLPVLKRAPSSAVYEPARLETTPTSQSAQ